MVTHDPDRRRLRRPRASSSPTATSSTRCSSPPPSTVLDRMKQLRRPALEPDGHDRCLPETSPCSRSPSADCSPTCSGCSSPRSPIVLGVAFMSGTLVLTATISTSFDDLFADVYENTDAVVRSSDVGRRRASASSAGLISDDVVADRRAGRRASASAEGHVEALRASRRQGRQGRSATRAGRADLRLNWLDRAGAQRAGSLDERVAAARGPDRGRASTPGRPRRPATWSATRSRCSGQHRRPRVHHRRHRQVRRRRQLRRAPSAALFDTADRPGARSAEPGKFNCDHRRPAPRASARRSSPTASSRCCPPASRPSPARHHRGDPGRHPGRALGVLQHLPAGLRRRRPVRRLVHHLQHLLDHRRPAHPGAGAAAGHRRQPRARSSARCSSRRSSSASSPRSSASSSASCWPSAQARCWRASASTSRPTGARRPAADGRHRRSSSARSSPSSSALAPGPAGRARSRRSPPCATSPSTPAAARAAGVIGRRRPRPSASALLFLGLFGDDRERPAAVGLGAAVVFLGVAVLGPVFARPAEPASSARRRRRHGASPGALARENAMRNPKRTAATAAAAHDRRRPGRLHHHPRRLDQGVGRRRHRRARSPATSSSTRGGVRRRRAPARARRPSSRELPEVDGGRRHPRSASPRSTATGDVRPRPSTRRDRRRSSTSTSSAGSSPTSAGDGIAVADDVRRGQRPAASATRSPATFPTRRRRRRSTVVARLRPDDLAGRLLVTGPSRSSSRTSPTSSTSRSSSSSTPGADRRRRSQAAVEQVVDAVPDRRACRTGPSSRPTQTAQIDQLLDAHLRAAGPGDLHRPARHRQHAGPVDLRAHPGARPAAGGGHDAGRQLRSTVRWESVIIALFGTVLGLRDRRLLRLGAGDGRSPTRASPTSPSRSASCRDRGALAVLGGSGRPSARPAGRPGSTSSRPSPPSSAGRVAAPSHPHETPRTRRFRRSRSGVTDGNRFSRSDPLPFDQPCHPRRTGGRHGHNRDARGEPGDRA